MLEVRLKKQFDGFKLDAQWQIEKELAVIFGLSGSGKSLTLQMIAGLIAADDGLVRINGETVFDTATKLNMPPYRRHIGYVFQHLALFPHIKVHENISYGLKGLRKNEKRNRVNDMIKLFHLQGVENKYPSDISGGQKQRTALARALIQKPQALLLDEPFSSLDNPLRVEMREMLKELKTEFSIPIIMVTHDIADAAETADRIIVYSKGKVEQIGEFADILENPSSIEVKRLIGCLPYSRLQRFRK
ncbi:molybdenum ABC transporter ATP-binding protein [Candidatus Magnetoovum chiemensis]|nr:molybdenum ABC transporter ATP-binding protein [Candidatus Magnetoovum chiemensis]